ALLVRDLARRTVELTRAAAHGGGDVLAAACARRAAALAAAEGLRAARAAPAQRREALMQAVLDDVRDASIIPIRASGQRLLEWTAPATASSRRVGTPASPMSMEEEEVPFCLPQMATTGDDAPW